MTTKVSYEWTLHVLDEHGDIVDHDFGDDLNWYMRGDGKLLREALTGHVRPDGSRYELELWRNRVNEDEGLVCRGYGYYDADTGLAKTFDLNATGDRESGGPKVPAKFFKQITAAKRALGIE